MIGKETWKDYKKNYSLKFRLTTMYVFVLMLVLMLAILTPFTLIATVPLVVLPFTFSYVALMGFPEAMKDGPIRSFFIFYPVYFQRIFFGGYRAWLGLLKSILISIVFSSIMTLILYYTYLRGQPGFAEILQEIEAAKSVAEMETAMNHFMDFGPATFTSQLASMVGAFFGIWTFIRHCLLNSEKFCFTLVNKVQYPMKATNRVYVVAAHLRRKQFYKEYLGAVWYLILIFLIAFGGGASLSFFVFKLGPMPSLFVGLFISLILLFPFIPYYFDVIRNICLASFDDYQEASIRLSEKLIMNLSKNNLLTEEELKKAQEEIAKGREAIKQMQELEEQEQKKAAEEEKNKKQ